MQAKPTWGLVLGSGLGPVAEAFQLVESRPFSEFPEIPESRVPGHQGRFLLCEREGERLVIAQGRCHLYEGHSARDVTAAVRALAEMGVKRLLLTNAAGCLRPEWAPGQWMMLSDHLNLTGASPLSGGPHFQDLTEVYAPSLRARAEQAARACGLLLREGVYASLPGPQYETPAEIRMYRSWGADAVGMSTVLEAIQARALGLEVAAFSCLTNYGAGMKPEALDHQDVLEVGSTAAESFLPFLEAFLSSDAR
ncbi:MAG: purine-nucleoside phosphorylase [Verrucomicrobiota bacterium]